MQTISEKILVVDDAKLNLKILTNILDDKYQIFTATSGREAIDIAKNEQPDLVLLDIILPDIDGFEVIKIFKNTDELRNIPIIFITGLSYMEDELKGLKLGAIDYIKKPFVEDIVRARVDNQILLCRQRKLVEEIAQYDALTQVPNRRNFESKLRAEYKYAQRNDTYLHIGYIDIDYFKQYNDNYGHAKGDDALRDVAHSVTKITEMYNGYFARIGGEEFCFMLPDSDKVNIDDAVNQVKDAVRNADIEHKYSKNDSVLTISVGGVSTKIDDDTDICVVLKRVDDNLYSAKEQGRNRVFWEKI